jgi:hypothetical protein
MLPFLIAHPHLLVLLCSSLARWKQDQPLILLSERADAIRLIEWAALTSVDQWKKVWIANVLTVFGEGGLPACREISDELLGLIAERGWDGVDDDMLGLILVSGKNIERLGTIVDETMGGTKNTADCWIDALGRKTDELVRK